jgi:polyisoprenyl-teichoic acid--peptidoglycan teichoic acid transferase
MEKIKRYAKNAKWKVTFSRIKRKIFRHVWLVRAILIAMIVFVFYLLFLAGAGVYKRSGADYYVDLVKLFINTPDESVKAIEGRTNILILGKGGEGHEAPDLTDTIIVVSVDNVAKRISTLSLPRDIWIPELRIKLNSAYYWGNILQPAEVETEKGGGIVLAKSTVEQLIGQPIQYAAVLDFNAFVEVIDVLEGVEVDVEHSFTDEWFPIPGRENDLCDGDREYRCRYETITFEKGLQYMDGTTALKFVRSRRAEGENGTDFARGERQQRVISAIKNKILTRDVLLSKNKVDELIAIARNNIETDIDDAAAAVLARRFIQSRDNMASFVLPEDMLDNPPYLPKYDNLYVFIPKGESWKEVQEWVGCIFTGKDNCN